MNYVTESAIICFYLISFVKAILNLSLQNKPIKNRNKNNTCTSFNAQFIKIDLDQTYRAV